MGANELSIQLWRQRELLEQLLFKFEEERILLVSARTRWIPHATREIETVVSRLKAASLVLSMTVSETAVEWGLAPEAKLRDVVAAAPRQGAWRDVLAAHVEALGGLVSEVTAIQADNSRLLQVALQAARETVNLTIGPGAGYDAAGAPASSAPVEHLVDTHF